MALNDGDLADIGASIHLHQTGLYNERALQRFRRGLVFNHADDTGFNCVGSFGCGDFKVFGFNDAAYMYGVFCGTRIIELWKLASELAILCHHNSPCDDHFNRQ